MPPSTAGGAFWQEALPTMQPEGLRLVMSACDEVLLEREFFPEVPGSLLASREAHGRNSKHSGFTPKRSRRKREPVILGTRPLPTQPLRALAR